MELLIEVKKAEFSIMKEDSYQSMTAFAEKFSTAINVNNTVQDQKCNEFQGNLVG